MSKKKEKNLSSRSSSFLLLSSEILRVAGHDEIRTDAMSHERDWIIPGKSPKSSFTQQKDEKTAQFIGMPTCDRLFSYIMLTK